HVAEKGQKRESGIEKKAEKRDRGAAQDAPHAGDFSACQWRGYEQQQDGNTKEVELEEYEPNESNTAPQAPPGPACLVSKRALDQDDAEKRVSLAVVDHRTAEIAGIKAERRRRGGSKN